VYSVIDEYVTVASVDDIPAGTAKNVTVGENQIAVFHVDDDWYALEGNCPHQGGPLAEGWIHEKTVTCPWHAWCFSLETGRMAILEMEGVATYDVRIDGGMVAINPNPREQAAPSEGS
jgi:nitrite reductase (NADH) small subunit